MSTFGGMKNNKLIVNFKNIVLSRGIPEMFIF